MFLEKNTFGLMTTFQKAVVLATLLSITGCSNSLVLKSAAYHTPNLSLPDQYKNQANWQLMPQLGWQLSANWWELFNDPALNTIQQQVIDANQTLVQAAARYRQAEAVLKQAQANGRAQLGSTASANRQSNQHNAGSLYSVGLNASWTPDLWGRIAQQIAAE